MFRLPFVIAALVACAGNASGQSEEAERFHDLVARGVELQNAGDAFGAIDSYKAALTLFPDHPDVLTNLGAVYVQLGEFDQAIAQYEAALRVAPTSTAARLNLALAYYKSGRPQEAIQPLRMVIASDPQARNAYLILADCYLQTGQDREAVTLLQPREALFGDDLAYAYVLGTALLNTGDEAGSQQYIDRIFRIGDTAEARLLMAIAHLNRHDYPEAKEELEQALKLNPKLPTANAAYGRTLLGLGDSDAAEQAFRRELALNSNDFESNLALGSLRRNAQRFDDAESYVRRAINLRPTDLTARKLLASLYLQTERNEEGLQLLEELARESPDSVDVRVLLATVYYRLGRDEDAARERAIIERLNAESQEAESGSRSAPSEVEVPEPQASQGRSR